MNLHSLRYLAAVFLFAVEVTNPSNNAMITLISCAGWNDDTWSYESRVVVKAQFKSWRVGDDLDEALLESKWSRPRTSS